MMLLWRREGESIVCTLPDGTAIVIRANLIKLGYKDPKGRVRPTKVQFGITAPLSIRVDREEVAALRAEPGTVEAAR